MITKENFGGIDIADMLIAAGLASTRSEARRYVKQGAIRLNDKVITDPFARVGVVNNEMVILEEK